MTPSARAKIRSRIFQRSGTVIVALTLPLLILTGCTTTASRSASTLNATAADQHLQLAPIESVAELRERNSPGRTWPTAVVVDNEEPGFFGPKDGEAPWGGLPLPVLWNLPQVRAYDNIQEYLERNSDNNGGVSVVETDYLVIHLLDGTAPTVELDALVNAARDVGSTVEFDHVQRALAGLMELQYFDIPEAIDASSLFAGTKVLQWGVNPDTNTVEVTVTEVTPPLAAQVLAEFGPAVSIIQGVDSHMFVARGRRAIDGSGPGD